MEKEQTNTMVKTEGTSIQSQNTEALIGEDRSEQKADAELAHLQALDDKVVDVIKTCYDPEIPVNIYELGLIYQVRVKAHGQIHIVMTLTTPHCPAAQSLPQEVKDKVRGIPGVTDVEIEIVWDPPWTPSRMSEAAKLELGFL